MAKRISELDALPNVAVPSEVMLPVAYAGTTYKMPASQIAGMVSKESLGLDRVDNTSDQEKPVSTKVATALNQKAERNHNHSASEILDLEQSVVEIVNATFLEGEGLVTFTGSEW